LSTAWIGQRLQSKGHVVLADFHTATLSVSLQASLA